MDRARREQLVKRLRELQTNTTDVEASDRVSAMSAAMLSLGERIAGELGRGGLDEVYIHGTTGYVLLTGAGVEAVLTVLAREQARLGLILLEMRRAAEGIGKLVGGRGGGRAARGT